MKSSAAAHLRTLDTSSSVSEEVSTALQSVRALVERLRKSARTVENKTGVTNAQLFLLEQIRTGRHLTVNELAALAMTTQSTVSIVLNRLESKGLVKRKRSPVDRRSVILQLTAAGKRLVLRAPRPATSEVMRALAALTKEELNALTSGLDALGRELGVTVKPPSMLFEEDGRGRPQPERTKRRATRRQP